MKESENRTDAETRDEKVSLLGEASTVSIPGVTRYHQITIPARKLDNTTLGELDEIEVYKEYGTVRVRPINGSD